MTDLNRERRLEPLCLCESSKSPSQFLSNNMKSVPISLIDWQKSCKLFQNFLDEESHSSSSFSSRQALPISKICMNRAKKTKSWGENYQFVFRSTLVCTTLYVGIYLSTWKYAYIFNKLDLIWFMERFEVIAQCISGVFLYFCSK